MRRFHALEDQGLRGGTVRLRVREQEQPLQLVVGHAGQLRRVLLRVVGGEPGQHHRGPRVVAERASPAAGVLVSGPAPPVFLTSAWTARSRIEEIFSGRRPCCLGM